MDFLDGPSPTIFPLSNKLNLHEDFWIWQMVLFYVTYCTLLFTPTFYPYGICVSWNQTNDLCASTITQCSTFWITGMPNYQADKSPQCIKEKVSPAFFDDGNLGIAPMGWFDGSDKQPSHMFVMLISLECIRWVGRTHYRLWSMSRSDHSNAVCLPERGR